jgi:hypothetical protein
MRMVQNARLMRIASHKANGSPARCNSAVDTKPKPGDTNETPTIHS